MGAGALGKGARRPFLTSTPGRAGAYIYPKPAMPYLLTLIVVITLLILMRQRAQRKR